MPQQRQRIVFCDCLDCAEQASSTDLASSTSPANEAAARQEPPPKCLVFVLSGVLLPSCNMASSGAETVLDTCNLPHLNRATAEGNLSVLTVRDNSAADSCSELAQLLNMYEEYQHGKEATSLADRFKGMQASFASNSSTTTQLAQSVGMISSSVLVPEHDLSAAPSTGVAPAVGSMFDDIGLPASILSIGKASRAVPGRQQADSSYLAALPDPTEAARRILQELGLQDAHAGLDVMMVHLDSNCSNEQQLQQLPQQEYKQQAGQQVSSSSSPIQSSLQRSTIAAPKTQEAARANAVAVLSWLDRTLRYLNNSSAFKDTMLLTVLATPGSTKLPAACPMLQSGGGDDLESRQVLEPSAVANSSSVGQLSAINALESVISEGALTQHSRQVKKPLQSWQQLGGSPLNIDPCRPLLCLRRLPGVIRRDSCTKFSLQDCCYNSGQLGLVVDRLLPEIAYKLGRALKYGA